jgi:hypothetical protein
MRQVKLDDFIFLSTVFSSSTARAAKDQLLLFSAMPALPKHSARHRGFNPVRRAIENKRALMDHQEYKSRRDVQSKWTAVGTIRNSFFSANYIE